MPEPGPWEGLARLVRGLVARLHFDDRRLSAIEDRLAVLDGGQTSAQCRQGIRPLSIRKGDDA